MPGGGGDALEIARENLPRQMPALALGGKQPGAARASRRDLVQKSAIEPHRRPGGVGERHEPLLVAFAAHLNERLPGARGGLRQRDQFGNAQAGGVEQFDQAGHARGREPLGGLALGRVEPLARHAQQPLDLVDAEDFRQRARAARPVDRQRRIVAAPSLEIKVLVELAHGRKPARDRGVGEAGRAARRPGRRGYLRRSPRAIPRPRDWRKSR